MCCCDVEEATIVTVVGSDLDGKCEAVAKELGKVKVKEQAQSRAA